MHRKLLTVAALATLALPVATSAAHAQIKFGIAAGATAPTGSFAKEVETGYHAMGSLLFLPPLAPVGFRVDGMFNEFNYKAPFADSKARVLAGTANAMFTSPGIMGPYLIGGVGIYRFSISPEPTVGASSQSDVGYNLGAGFRFALAGFSAYGEARYHYVNNGAYRFVPITFGVTF